MLKRDTEEGWPRMGTANLCIWFVKLRLVFTQHRVKLELNQDNQAARHTAALSQHKKQNKHYQESDIAVHWKQLLLCPPDSVLLYS